MEATPRISDGALAYKNGTRDRVVAVGSDDWWRWLEAPGTTRFRFEGDPGSFTARRERRANRRYWYGYRKRGGRLVKAYLGRSRELDLARLAALAAKLSEPVDEARPGTPGRSPPGSSDRAARWHNLPSPPDRLVGRDEDVEHVRTRVLRDEVRLLTLTGTGGTGKTRLALRAAEEMLPHFEHGVLFVDLAPISEPSLLIPRIARTLGIRETGERPLIERVKGRLRDRSALLVLDNFEQLLPAAPDVTEILVECPRLKVLVTSREALGLRWERVFVVPPLELPQLRPLPALEALHDSPAVALFLQRARAAAPDFRLTEANARAVAEICVRLDGLPLAIDLAAAHTTALSAEGIQARLEHRFDLLKGGARDLPPRHRALREAVGWSYDLLTPGEQAHFRRLAVFAGGFASDAAETVSAGVDSPALDVLASLVAKNLLVAQQAEIEDGHPRFRMLESIREYAFEHLAASGELETTRYRHAEHFLVMAEAAEPELTGPEQLRVLDRLEREHDDIRAALRWLLDTQRPEEALRLAGALGRFWEMHSHLAEGRRWLETALSRAADAPAHVRAKALRVIGFLAGDQSDFAAARTATTESLVLWRELGDKEGMGRALNSLGNAYHLQGEYATARGCYEEALALFRDLGDTRLIAMALSNLGNAAQTEGDYQRAVAYGTESLRLRRQIGDTFGVATTLNNLAEAPLAQGDDAAAAPLLEESLVLWRTIGDKLHNGIVLTNLARLASRQGDHPRATTLLAEALRVRGSIEDASGVAESLEALAGVAANVGRFAHTIRLCAAAAGLRDAAGAPIRPVDQAEYEHIVAAARGALPDREFAEAWTAGRALSMEAAVRDAQGIAEALERAAILARRARREPGGALSPREREVAALVARGLTNWDIAERLVVSVRTAEGHVERIRGKLRLRSRAQVAAWAVEHGLARDHQETGTTNR